MAFLPLKFSKSWKNSEDFPTYEPDEEQVRADMQLLHDETRDCLNGLVEALNDPSAAEQLPFRPGRELKAVTVQAAVEEVCEKTKQAAAGTIVDHAIGKEKLTRELLLRTYGGRLWVSMEEPTEAHNPETDFPVGQLWMQPSVTMTNLAEDHWTVTGGRKEAVSGGWRLVTDGTTAQVYAEQELGRLGSPGDRMVVCIRVKQRSSRPVMLQMRINEQSWDLLEEGAACSAVLDGSGGLDLGIIGVWPAAAAGETVELADFTVVNVSRLEQSVPDCRFPADWTEFVWNAVPFTTHTSPMTLFVQSQAGCWETAVCRTLPPERGGTGLSAYKPGQMLCADRSGRLKPLEPPAGESFLVYDGGSPVWSGPERSMQMLGGLRMAGGTYEGDGRNGRTVVLPVTPKLLYLQPQSGPFLVDDTRVVDNPTVLADGGRAMAYSLAPCTDGGYVGFTATAELHGNTLRFQWTGTAHPADRTTQLGNRRGVVYNWLAIY